MFVKSPNYLEVTESEIWVLTFKWISFIKLGMFRDCANKRPLTYSNLIWVGVEREVSEISALTCRIKRQQDNYKPPDISTKHLLCPPLLLQDLLLKMGGVLLTIPTCGCWDCGRCTGPAAPLRCDVDAVEHARCQAPQGVRLRAARDKLLSPVAVSGNVDQSERVQLGQGALPPQRHSGLRHFCNCQVLGTIQS